MEIVNPPSQKVIEVSVVVPVEDLASPAPTIPSDPHAEVLDDPNPTSTPSGPTSKVGLLT